MPDAAPLEPGDPRALGQYEVVGRLGAGGQGAVFLGRAPGGEYVAVKLLHAQMANDPAARARFTREVAAAQKVEPFCTARVLEADVHGDQPYVVSEFIDGPSLHDVVAHDGPRGAQELERLAIGTVTALAAIHEAGIVHRDFKPNNVMLASDGPRVVDFGIARTVNSQESAVTATGMVVGTPGYLAPEQLTGAPLTPAVDIFAWAATMVFAATGQSPFEADTLPVIINRILNEDPDLSALPAGPLRDLIGRCLSKDAGLRPPAAQLLLHLLGHVGAAPGAQAGGQEELLNQGTRIASQLAPPPPVPRPQQPPRHQITPPPMPMHQGGMPPGPNTPPPQPITPPPMAMYQAPPPHTPPPMQMGQPVPPGPGYAPPKRSGGPGPAIAIGCGVLALIVLVVVVAIIVVATSDDEPDTDPYTPPSFTYTPPETPTGLSTSRGGIIGVWSGDGTQPGAASGSTSFKVRFTLAYSLGFAVYTYPSSAHTECRTRLSHLSGTAESSRIEYRETPYTGMDPKECASGYITFIPSGSVDSGSTIRWEWRQVRSSASADAYGTVTR
ncbi:serine/threonine protein kinase [Spirillospora sp. NBC_00431]